jgi:hypothetical protein
LAEADFLTFALGAERSQTRARVSLSDEMARRCKYLALGGYGLFTHAWMLA